MQRAVAAAVTAALAMHMTACDKDVNGLAVPQDTTPVTFSDTTQLANAVGERTTESRSTTMTMRMDLGLVSVAGHGVAEFDGADTAMAITMNFDGATMDNKEFELRLIDQIVYVKGPDDTQRDPSRPWLKMPLAEMPDDQNFRQFLEQADPAKTLEILDEAGDITDSKPDTINDQQATRYTIDIDVDKANSMFGTDQSDADIEDAGIDAIPMMVWLDPEGLPLRFEMDLAMIMRQVAEAAGDQLPESMSDAKVVITYEDWGQPVTIELPPADEIADP